MKHKFINAALVSLGLIAIIALAWSIAFPSYTWRYKITVNVDTPDGVKSGSAVREVINRDNTLLGMKLPDVGARISKVIGEAVVIDLGRQGVVFGLIENGSYGELYSAFFVQNASNTTDDFKNLKIGMSAPLPKQNWPQFITFQNIGDPKSVTLVKGRRFDVKAQDMLPVDDTEPTLGEGIKIKEVVINIVNEPVTWGMVDKFLSKDFWDKYHVWVGSTKITEREFTRLFRFREGN